MVVIVRLEMSAESLKLVKLDSGGRGGKATRAEVVSWVENAVDEKLENIELRHGK